MNKYGYIPIKNFIISVNILDSYNNSLYTYNYDSDKCIYITNNYQVINILNYIDNKCVSKINYEYDEHFYKVYYDLDATKSGTHIPQIHRSKLEYNIDNIYTDYRFYYKNLDVALSKIYFSAKLYLNKSGLYKSYHEKGYIKEEFYHVNGNIEGLYKKYYNSCNELEEEIEYVNGKKHGFCKKYNGGLDSHENYIMDKKHGLCIYNNIGRCGKEYRVEITYDNDIINGIYRKYYNNKIGGNLHIECNFKNNKYFGIYREYDVNNNLLIECDYKIYNKSIKIEDIK
jgi:antitoxin component YwqK of YwqJK toxin-antitoxin module